MEQVVAHLARHVVLTRLADQLPSFDVSATHVARLATWLLAAVRVPLGVREAHAHLPHGWADRGDAGWNQYGEQGLPELLGPGSSPLWLELVLVFQKSIRLQHGI